MNVQIATLSPTSHRCFTDSQSSIPQGKVNIRSKHDYHHDLEFDFDGPVREMVRTQAIIGQLFGLIQSLQHFPFDGRLDCQFTSRGHCDMLGHMSLYNPTLEGALRDTLQHIELVGRSISTRQGITHLTISFSSEIVEIRRN